MNQSDLFLIDPPKRNYSPEKKEKEKEKKKKEKPMKRAKSRRQRVCLDCGDPHMYSNGRCSSCGSTNYYEI